MPFDRDSAVWSGGERSDESSAECGWNHNHHYHPLVLRHVPSPCTCALDVGCGQGLLTRQLAARCEAVVGIDLDEPTSRSNGGVLPANCSYVAGDVLTYPFAPASFHFVAVVATLHHLALERGLARMRELLAPGGVLVVIGLCRASGPLDLALASVALPASHVIRRLRGYAEVQARTTAPRETFPHIKQVAAQVLPGTVLRRRLFFRYSLIWRKPG